MNSSEWEAANEDDADRWTRYQAHTGLAPDDGLVWRDRGVIIAQLTAENERLKAARDGWMETLEQWEARVAELEGSCQKLRDDYQGALAASKKAAAQALRDFAHNDVHFQTAGRIVEDMLAKADQIEADQ